MNGGVLNREYNIYRTSRNSIFDFDAIYAERENLSLEDMFVEPALKLLAIARNASDEAESEKAYEEFNKLEESKEAYTEKAKAIEAKIDRFHQEVRNWEIQYITDHVSVPS